ncbi:major facilitator superfamily domain-containing protein [Aspergillus oleicola]
MCCSVAILLLLLVLLSNTIVGTATPKLTKEIHALNDFVWYGLTTFSTQFLFRKLYMQFRVKWVLMSAVIILEIDSVVSAAARGSATFLVGRAIAGVAISHTVPLCLGPIFNSTVGGLECIAMIVAPVIGGALTTLVSWRWCFYINLPIGEFTVLVIIFLFKNPENQKYIIATLVVSGVSSAILVAFEMMRKDEATIPRSMLPLWFQSVNPASAASSGQMLLSNIIPLSLSTISPGFNNSIIGHYITLMLLGSDMTCIRFGFLTTFTPNTGKESWIRWQVLLSLEMGLSSPMPSSAIQLALKQGDIPLGMAGVGFAIAFGGAVSVSIAQNIFMNPLRNGLSSVPRATGFLEPILKDQKGVLLSVYNGAVTRCFWMGVVAAALGFGPAVGTEWRSVEGE